MTRLLTGASSLADHLTRHGALPDLTSRAILDAADAAGVRGRGGGGFPLSRKLRAAAEHRGGTVIGNWSEGEPASRKDAALLDLAPHLVVDGALLAADAIKARRVVLAAHEGGPARRVRKVLAERSDARRIELLEIPDRYVAGEASALVSALHGGPSLPQQRHTPLATGRRPHLVLNAETLACLALLVRGIRQIPLLVTLRGAVRPSVVEVPAGTTVRGALDSAGGLTEPAQAFLIGGYFGLWLTAADALDIPLTQDDLRAAGGVLGAALVIALPTAACGLAATAQVVRYLADQSARQCGPCLNGLPAIASELEVLASGGPADLQRLLRWCGMVTGRGACSHPDGAAGLTRSALASFAPDVDLHLRGGCGRPSGDAMGLPQ